MTTGLAKARESVREALNRFGLKPEFEDEKVELADLVEPGNTIANEYDFR